MIDEVAMMEENQLKTLRNTLREAGFIVILLGTNSCAVNMIQNAGDVSRAGAPNKWCYIVSDLPTTLVESITDLKPNWRKLIEDEAEHSRPWIIHLMIDFARKQNRDLDADSLDELTSSIWHTIVASKVRQSNKIGFMTGQVCLYKPAHLSEISKTSLITYHFFNIEYPQIAR